MYFVFSSCSCDLHVTDLWSFSPRTFPFLCCSELRLSCRTRVLLDVWRVAKSARFYKLEKVGSLQTFRSRNTHTKSAKRPGSSNIRRVCSSRMCLGTSFVVAFYKCCGNFLDAFQVHLRRKSYHNDNFYSLPLKVCNVVVGVTYYSKKMCAFETLLLCSSTTLWRSRR